MVLTFQKTIDYYRQIFLTDTHVMPEQDITGTNCLGHLHVFHDKSTGKFEGPVSASRSSVDVVSHHQIPGKSLFSYRKSTFMQVQLSILLLYLKIVTKNAGFYKHLRQIKYSQNINLSLGNSNTNELDYLLNLACDIKLYTGSDQILQNFRSFTFSDHVTVVLTLLLKSNAKIADKIFEKNSSFNVI